MSCWEIFDIIHMKIEKKTVLNMLTCAYEANNGKIKNECESKENNKTHLQ